MVKATRLLPDGSQTDRHSRNGRRAITMPSTHSQSHSYKLKSVRTECPPSGAEGVGWHRYVITQGDNTIVGHRQGSTSGVTLAVEEIVLRLNERQLGNFRRALGSRYPNQIKKRILT